MSASMRQPGAPPRRRRAVKRNSVVDGRRGRFERRPASGKEASLAREIAIAVRGVYNGSLVPKEAVVPLRGTTSLEQSSSASRVTSHGSSLDISGRWKTTVPANWQREGQSGSSLCN
jgi:hypothetical protein